MRDVLTGKEIKSDKSLEEAQKALAEYVGEDFFKQAGIATYEDLIRGANPELSDAEVAKRVDSMTPKPMLVDYVWAVKQMRYLSILAQSCHWYTKGTGSFSDHELFKMVYQKLDEQLDILAEKLVGTVNLPELNLTPVDQGEFIYQEAQTALREINLASAVHDATEMSGYLKEKLLLTSSNLKTLMEGIKRNPQAGDVPLGYENLIPGIADELEKLAYFLGRRARSVPAHTIAANLRMIANGPAGDAKYYCDSCDSPAQKAGACPSCGGQVNAVLKLATEKPRKIKAGDRVRVVEDGQTMNGTVRSIDGKRVWVKWDGGVENEWPLRMLTLIG